MKTAMQEFIEDNFYIDMDGEYMLKWTEDTPMTDVVKQALEKEKEQICNAYTDGLEGPYVGAEQYYNETYNQNEG
jgi:hypothetical protein